MIARHLSSAPLRLSQSLNNGKRGISLVKGMLQPQKPVIVLAAPRTGSTLMAEYLSSLAELQYLNAESLNPRSFPILERLPANSWGQRAILLKLRKDCLQCQPNRAVLKLMTSQLDQFSISLEAVQRCFPEAQFVVIYRRALAKMYVSRKWAMVSDEWQMRDRPTSISITASRTASSQHTEATDTEEAKSKEQTQIRFDLQEMEQYAESIRSQYRQIQSVLSLNGSRGDGSSIAVAYEDLCEDAETVFRDQVCDFLGTPFQSLSSTLNRQSRGDWKAKVKNRQEFEACLEQFDWEMRYPLAGGTGVEA